MVNLLKHLPILIALFQSTQAVSYVNKMNPGMAMRLEQRTFEAFKRAMVDFLPHFINYDVEWPTSYSYKFSLLFDWLNMTFNWRDIKYEELKFDIKDIILQFSEKDGR